MASWWLSAAGSINIWLISVGKLLQLEGGNINLESGLGSVSEATIKAVFDDESTCRIHIDEGSCVFIPFCYFPVPVAQTQQSESEFVLTLVLPCFSNETLKDVPHNVIRCILAPLVKQMEDGKAAQTWQKAFEHWNAFVEGCGCTL